MPATLYTLYARSTFALTALLLLLITPSLGAMAHSASKQSCNTPQKNLGLEQLITLLEKNDGNIPQDKYYLRTIMLGISTQLLKIQTNLKKSNEQLLAKQTSATYQSLVPFETHEKQLRYCEEFLKTSMPSNNSPESALREAILTSIHDLRNYNKKSQKAALTIQAANLQAKL